MATDDKKSVAASYDIQFYQEVQTLNHNQAAYMGQIIDLKNQYGEQYADKIPQEEKLALRETISNVRYTLIKALTILEVLLKQFRSKLKNPKDYEDLLKQSSKMIDKPVFSAEELHNVIVGINSFMVEAYVQDLLITSQDYIDQVANV